MSDVGGSAQFEVQVDTSGLSRLGREAAQAQQRLRESLEDTDNAANQLARRLRALSGLNAGAGPRISRQFTESSRAVRQFGADLQALVTRTRAFQRSFQARGLDPNLLALQTNQLEKLLDLQRRARADMRRIAADPAVRRAYELEFAAIARVITREGQQIVSEMRDNESERTAVARAAARERSEIAARELVEQRRLARLDVVGAQSLGRTAGARAQTAGQLAITQARAAGQARVAITRGVVDTIGRLERGLGITVAGIARTTTSAVARLWSGTVGSVSRSFATRRSIISRNLNSETRLFSQQSIQIQRIQQQASRGLIGSARFGGLAGGLGAGLSLGALATSGFQRAADIENVQKRLNVLLNNNVFASRALFLQLAAFARTTAFDLTGVSDLASRLLAVGVQADQVLPNIKALSGAITLVGGTTDDLNGIARAIGQIGSVGRLTAEEINQISERLPGINVRQLFTDALGFENQAAFVKAQEAGEITGEAAIAAFFKAVRGDPRFAQALEAGADSFSNLKANAIESFSDIGAAFFERLEGPIKAGLRGTITAFAGLASFIRGGELSGQMEILRLALTRIGIALLGIVAAKGAVEVFQLLGRGFALLLTPLGAMTALLAGASAAFLFFFERSEAFRRTVLELRDQAVAFARSIGTNLIARLRELGRILSPVVERLRGFGENVVSAFRNIQRAFQAGGLSGGFRALLGQLGVLGSGLGRILEPVRERIVDVLSNLGDIGIRIRDRIVESLRSIDFGAVLSRLGGIINTNLGRIGVGALAGGVLGGPLGAALGAAFAVAVNIALPRLRQALGNINVLDLFGRFLEGTRQVARRLGEILTDRRTLIAVGAVAAAAAAFAAQFIRGFAEGVISNLPEIAGLGADIMQALFAQNSMVKSIVALVLLLRGPLVAMFRKVFGDAGREGGKAAIDGASQGAQSRMARFRATLTAGMKGAGQAAAVGLAAALSGSALGEATSGLEQGLGAAGLAGAVGQAFAIAPGPIGASLAAATAGVGILTTALSANARAAREAEADILGFKAAIEQTGSVAGGLGSQLAGTLDERFGSLQEVLADVGFRVQDFQDAFAQGRADEFIDRVRQRVLEASGSIVDAAAVTELLEQAVKRVGEAAERTDLEEAIAGQGGGRAFELVLEIVGNLRDRINEARIAAQNLNRQRQATFLQDQLTSVRDRATEIGEEADTARTKLQQLLNPPDTAAAATAQTVTNVGSFGAQLTEGLELSKGVQTALGNAQVQQAVEGFGADVALQISESLLEANPGQALQDSVAQTRLAIVQSPELSEEAKQAFIDELDRQFAVAQTEGIPLGVAIKEGEAEKAGLEALAAATESATTAGTISLAAAADILSAVQAGELTAETAKGIVAAAPAIVGAIPNMSLAAAAGSSIATEADAVVQSNGIVISNISADTGKARQVGQDIIAGLRGGIFSGATSIATAAATVVTGAISAARKAAGAASPSKEFMRIGADLMEGLAIGIRDNSDQVTSAIQSVVDAIIDPSSPLQRGMREGISSLFGGLFDRARILGGGNSQRAIGEITSAMRNIIETVESNASTLFGIGAKAANERTLSERLLLGESFTSLRIGDEFGVANRNAIQQAVDNIIALGEAMLEQGFTATQTANRLDDYRSALIQTAAQAGLSTAEVVRFVDQLGLSPQAIGNFINEVNRLNAVAGEARRRAGQPTTPNLTPGQNPNTQFFQLEEGAINISVPDGADGEFVALTTVNAIAQAVRT